MIIRLCESVVCNWLEDLWNKNSLLGWLGFKNRVMWKIVEKLEMEKKWKWADRFLESGCGLGLWGKWVWHTERTLFTHHLKSGIGMWSLWQWYLENDILAKLVVWYCRTNQLALIRFLLVQNIWKWEESTIWLTLLMCLWRNSLDSKDSMFAYQDTTVEEGVLEVILEYREEMGKPQLRSGEKGWEFVFEIAVDTILRG